MFNSARPDHLGQADSELCQICASDVPPEMHAPPDAIQNALDLLDAAERSGDPRPPFLAGCVALLRDAGGAAGQARQLLEVAATSPALGAMIAGARALLEQAMGEGANLPERKAWSA